MDSSILSTGALRRAAAGLFAILLPVLALAAPVAAPPLPDGVSSKLDPRLLPLAGQGAGPVSAWVGFADKGEQGPADLARRLAEAEAALDPHARARRLKAGVFPLVDYLDLPVHAPYLEALEALGLEPYGASRWFNQVAVRATAGQLVAAAGLAFVTRLAPVEHARPIGDGPDVADAPPPRAALPTAAERAASLAYGLTASQLAQINVPALHDSGYIGTGVRVCVLDDGFNHHGDHPALAGADVRATRDFVRGTDDPTDPNAPAFTFEHGTNTFGCIAGNVPGRYVGAAPGATFLLGRTEDDLSEHLVELVYWGMGAEWADSLGADVISSSVGYTTFDSPDPSYTYADLDGHTTIITRAVEIAASKGILVVNAAGNEGDKSWHYIVAPADAAGDSMLAVAAVNPLGSMASFSSFGPSADGRTKPDLAAQGVGDWLVAAADTGYVTGNGTSFACPLVAGLAACLMQARPAWSPRTIVRALKLTASQAAAPDDRLGWGIANGATALLWVPDSAGVPGLPPLALELHIAGSNPITPASPATAVNFGTGPGLPRPTLRVFDAQGRIVAHDLAYRLNPAAARDGLSFTATWDGRGDTGRLLRSGIYFITLEAGGRRSAVRLISLR
jgi:subtilisin family serine protease